MNIDKASLRHVAQKIPRDIRGLMSQNYCKLIVGGGFIREIIAGNSPVDIDLFTDSPERAAVIAKDLVNMRPGSRMHTTKNAITVLTPDRLPVQFVTRWTYKHPTDVVKSFDFTVCQVAIWRSGPACNDAWEGECAQTFYQDLAGRNLVYSNPVRDEEAGGSLLRVLKFLKRGYSIQVTSLGDILSRFSDAADRLSSGIQLPRRGFDGCATARG